MRSGMSTIGWLELSPAALRSMRQELAEKGDGVVDEIFVFMLCLFLAVDCDRNVYQKRLLHVQPEYSR